MKIYTGHLWNYTDRANISQIPVDTTLLLCVQFSNALVLDFSAVSLSTKNPSDYAPKLSDIFRV